MWRARWSKGMIRASGAREPSSTLGRAPLFHFFPFFPFFLFRLSPLPLPFSAKHITHHTSLATRHIPSAQQRI